MLSPHKENMKKTSQKLNPGSIPVSPDTPIFVIAVVGPTAVGKSDFAVQIAKIFDGEVISADSRQVYTGLDIGSGKITKKEMLSIPHHGLDIANPKSRKVFTASDFQTYARQKISEISARGRLPIICGGTGFYIDVALGNIELSEVKPNPYLRKKLEALSTPRLLSMLKKLSVRKYKTIDQNNRVRIIRAIEIEKGHATEKNKLAQKTKPNYAVLYLGLDASDEILKSKIHTRLIKRMRGGMIDEVTRLHKQGVSYKKLFSFGLEYRYLSLFLQKKITRDELITRLNYETWHYVKRQRTWFGRNQNIIWIKKSS